MTVNWTGPILALLTVATIAVGHVLVRRLNYRFGTWPAIPFFIAGIAIVAASLFFRSNLVSAVLGIIGLTTLVDGNEMLRQEKRILKGHAPENPKRPIRAHHTRSQIKEDQ